MGGLTHKRYSIEFSKLIGYEENDLSLKYQWIENATSLEDELEQPSPNFKIKLQKLQIC